MHDVPLSYRHITVAVSADDYTCIQGTNTQVLSAASPSPRAQEVAIAHHQQLPERPHLCIPRAAASRAQDNIAMASDLDTLLEMGFDKARAELAIKQSGGRECHLKLSRNDLDT